MTVTGYDATHDNVGSLPTVADVVMGYDTGTPDIMWTAADWHRFPTMRHVHIDQGANGSPVLTATVRDVETGAWTPDAAVRDTVGWNPARPTIYCNMSTLPAVLNAGWRRDLWLAIPSDAPPTQPPVVPGCTVVAVQWRFAGPFDQSVVFDHDWPEASGSRPPIQYLAPAGVIASLAVSLSWNPVPAVDNIPPTGYTVEAYGLDGKLYGHAVTTQPHVVIPGLMKGWTYNVRVWANGGNIAPPHATITVIL